MWLRSCLKSLTARMIGKRGGRNVQTRDLCGLWQPYKHSAKGVCTDMFSFSLGSREANVCVCVLTHNATTREHGSSSRVPRVLAHIIMTIHCLTPPPSFRFCQSLPFYAICVARLLPRDEGVDLLQVHQREDARPALRVPGLREVHLLRRQVGAVLRAVANVQRGYHLDVVVCEEELERSRQRRPGRVRIVDQDGLERRALGGALGEHLETLQLLRGAGGLLRLAHVAEVV